MGTDWTDVPGHDEDDPAHEAVKRYARLSFFELRALRDRLQSLANDAEKEPAMQCRRLAKTCDQILSWHPYATEWNWDEIFGNATLRGHAKCVQAALRNRPDETDGAPIFRQASAYYGYDGRRHEEAMQEYLEEQKRKKSFPNVTTLEAWEETFSSAYESDAPRQRVEKQYRNAGWSADGGRDELEKLTEAILRATKTGVEREEGTNAPPFNIFIGE